MKNDIRLDLRGFCEEAVTSKDCPIGSGKASACNDATANWQKGPPNSRLGGPFLPVSCLEACQEPLRTRRGRNSNAGCLTLKRGG